MREPHAPDRPQVRRGQLLRDRHSLEVERAGLVSLDPFEAGDAAAARRSARDAL